MQRPCILQVWQRKTDKEGCLSFWRGRWRWCRCPFSWVLSAYSWSSKDKAFPGKTTVIKDLTKAHLFFYRWSDRFSFSIPKWPQLPLPLSSIVLIFNLEVWRRAHTCLQWRNTHNCWYRSCGRSYKTARWLQNSDRSVKLSEGAFDWEIRI